MRRALLAFLWRRHRLSLCLSLVVPLFVGVGIGLVCPYIQEQSQAFAALPFLQRFLGGDAASAFSPLSLLSFPLRHPLVLLLYAVFPAIPILGLPAGERGRGGLDLILAAPVERRALIGSVCLFVAVTAPLLLAFSFLGSITASAVAGELTRIPIEQFALGILPAAGLVSIWTGVALIVSVRARNRTSAALVFGAVVAAAFILDSTARLSPDVSWLARYTPFGYFRPDEVVLGTASWAPASFGLALVGVVLCLVGAALEVRRTSA